MGSSLPIMVTKRSGTIECKRVVKWSAVFQLVFQLKIKKDINVVNQYLNDRIQITPASKDVHGRLLCTRNPANQEFKRYLALERFFELQPYGAIF